MLTDVFYAIRCYPISFLKINWFQATELTSEPTKGGHPLFANHDSSFCWITPTAKRTSESGRRWVCKESCLKIPLYYLILLLIFSITEKWKFIRWSDLKMYRNLKLREHGKPIWNQYWTYWPVFAGGVNNLEDKTQYQYYYIRLHIQFRLSKPLVWKEVKLPLTAFTTTTVVEKTFRKVAQLQKSNKINWKYHLPSVLPQPTFLTCALSPIRRTMETGDSIPRKTCWFTYILQLIVHN